MPLPCCASAVFRQRCVLRESPRVTGKIRTANREIPRGSRKKPNLSRTPTGRQEMADVNSHITCRAMPRPWEVVYKSAWSEHGRATVCYVWIKYGRTAVFKWETQYKSLARRNEMGTALYLWISLYRIAVRHGTQGSLPCMKKISLYTQIFLSFSACWLSLTANLSAFLNSIRPCVD